MVAAKRNASRVKFLPWILAISGIACTAIVYLLFLADQKTRFDAEFRFDATQRFELIKDSFSGLVDDLDSAGRFFEESSLVEEASFEAFVRPWVTPGHCSAVLWVVPAGESSWLDTGGASSVRAVYSVPSSPTSLGVPLVLENPAVKAALALAQTRGLTSVSVPIYMPWDRLQPGVVVCRPVFNTADDEGHRFFGAVVGLISIGEVAWGAISATPPAGLPTTIRDAQAGSDAPRYVHQPRLGKRLEKISRYSSTKLSIELGFGDRIWMVDVEPSTAYVATRGGSVFYSTLLGGLAALGMSAVAIVLARGKSVADAKAEAKSAEFERFFTTGLDLFAIIGSDGTLKRLNPMWETVLGVPFNRMEGLPYEEFIHPDDKAATLSALEGLGKGVDLEGFVSRVRAGDGSYRSLECRARLAPGGTLIYAAARDISDRLEMEHALRRSIVEKEALLKEVHHRVKNNMQVVSSLLDLEAMKHDDPVFLEAAREAQNRIRSMGMIHEQLYRQSTMSDVELGDYVRALGDRLVDEYASVPATVSVSILGVRLDLDRAIPCGLIINELLTNSLKYGQRDGAELTIKVSGSVEGDECVLRIEDDGPGLPPGAVERSRAGSTLGLGLVLGLAGQLRGALELLPGPGARWELRFPLSPPPS